ncbi:hypothetical protein AAVH_15026 [Aphelenchoides avenae]|nr:hypothetical protein AAVH_15026 [Aphelenchus avenae]
MASSVRSKQYSRIRRLPYSRRMRKRELYAQGIMLARAVTATILSPKTFTIGLTVPLLFSVSVLLTCETLAAVSQISLNDFKDSSRAMVDISRQLLPSPALNLSEVSNEGTLNNRLLSSFCQKGLDMG